MVRENVTAERIAEAALRLLEKGGADKVTMRRVAKAVGITAMAIYHHYPSREALLRAISDAEFAKMINLFDQKPARRSAEFRLRTMTEAYVNYAFARPMVFDYVFSKHRPDALRFPRDFHARRSLLANRVADTVADAMREGALKKDDVWEVAMGLWAHVHGYVALYRGGRFDLSEDEFRRLFRRSLRRFLNGLKAR